MPEIAMPSDLGAELSEAARWYAGELEMEAFLAHIRAGHAWSERMPRKLLAWANRHAIPIFGHRRFVLVLNAGFDYPEGWRLWRVAKAELRRARAAIARGEEAGMIYSGDRDMLAFGEGGPRRWGAPDGFVSCISGSFPSPAGPAPEPALSLPGAATLFLVVAIMHLLRIIFGWQVEIGGLSIPFWVSWLALPVAGALAYFGFTQNR